MHVCFLYGSLHHTDTIMRYLSAYPTEEELAADTPR